MPNPWTRRGAVAGALAVGASAALAQTACSPTPSAPARPKLDLSVYQADEAGFRRTPVILTGDKEALLIDGGFNLSDGRALAERIKATGKALTTIYVSCSDPDYYFGLRPVVEAFPAAKVLAAPATVEAIKANVRAKLDTWGPQLKDNGPKTLADVVMPTPSEVVSLDLEGRTVEIVTVEDMKDRRYLWSPDLKAVFGGVLVSSGVHVWTADEPTPGDRERWISALDEIIARRPEIVVPSHKTAEAPSGLPAVTFTRNYLAAFNAEAAKAVDSAALIAAMTRLYPDLQDASSLALGAKVAKGEMKWG